MTEHQQQQTLNVWLEWKIAATPPPHLNSQQQRLSEANQIIDRLVGCDWRTDMQFLAARSLWMMFLLLRYSIPCEMSNMNRTSVCRDRS